MASIETRKFNALTGGYDKIIINNIGAEDFAAVVLLLSSMKETKKFYEVVLKTDKNESYSFYTIHPDPVSYINANHRKQWQQDLTKKS